MYPRPKLTADAIVVDDKLQILMIRRKNAPFKGMWALPGGFVNEYEDPMKAACRELEEETSVLLSGMYPLDVFGKKGRDPRGWVVSCVYYKFCGSTIHTQKIKAKDDATALEWIPIQEILYDMRRVAFDHHSIIEYFNWKLECNSL
jgi:8-oxo-dGTP diphosphatase